MSHLPPVEFIAHYVSVLENSAPAIIAACVTRFFKYNGVSAAPEAALRGAAKAVLAVVNKNQRVACQDEWQSFRESHGAENDAENYADLAVSYGLLALDLRPNVDPNPVVLQPTAVGLYIALMCLGFVLPNATSHDAFFERVAALAVVTKYHMDDILAVGATGVRQVEDLGDEAHFDRRDFPENLLVFAVPRNSSSDARFNGTHMQMKSSWKAATPGKAKGKAKGKDEGKDEDEGEGEDEGKTAAPHVEVDVMMDEELEKSQMFDRTLGKRRMVFVCEHRQVLLSKLEAPPPKVVPAVATPQGAEVARAGEDEDKEAEEAPARPDDPNQGKKPQKETVVGQRAKDAPVEAPAKKQRFHRALFNTSHDGTGPPELKATEYVPAKDHNVGSFRPTLLGGCEGVQVLLMYGWHLEHWWPLLGRQTGKTQQRTPKRDRE